jgi:hypothetical protein
MIRYKPTRITIGENDIHESLERMLLRHTRFAEWHEHDTDQSDIENNADATSVDSDSFPPYAFSHFGGSNCERESDSLFHEGLSHGSWRRNDGHFPVLPSNEEHRSSLSAGPQWGHGINLSQLTSAAVSGLGSLDPVHGYRSFVETDPPVLSGAESLLKDIHLQSSVKPLVACCAEQLYHSLRAHLLFSALPRNSLTRWENTINTPYERVKKFFTSPENRTAQRSPLHSHPQRDTNFLDFTLPAVFSAYTILANGIYHLEEGNTSGNALPNMCCLGMLTGCLIDNTGLALILPNSEKANIDTKLREEKFSLKQVVSFSQALDFCSSICSDKGAHFQTSPMTEPARKILKATEGSQADSSFSSQIGRTQLKARRRSIDYDSDTESHVSEVELPHKPHQVATLTISSENGAARGSERESSSSLSDIPSMEDPTFDDLSADGERQNEDSEDGTNGSIDIQISSPERDQHDSPYLHSHGDTTEEESSPKSKLSTIQVCSVFREHPSSG